jgi:hypothetical protein
MENQVSDQQDEELDEATKGLEPQDGNVEEEKFEDLGEIKSEEPHVPEVDLKPFPKGLKYEFFGPRHDLSSHRERRVESRRK